MIKAALNPICLTLVLAVTGAALAIPPRRAPARSAKAAPARAPALKPFTFKTVTAGEPNDGMAPLWCQDAQPDEQNCRAFYEKDVAGIAIPEGIYYTLYKHHLSSMYFPIGNGGYQVSILTAAFTEKYGAPCRKSVDKWQSKAGAVFGSVTVTWCFTTGQLTLKERTSDRDTGEVEYLDENHAPAKPRPRDF